MERLRRGLTFSGAYLTYAIPETVAEVLRSRSATFVADGELYRKATCDAATGLGIDVALYP